MKVTSWTFKFLLVQVVYAALVHKKDIFVFKTIRASPYLYIQGYINTHICVCVYVDIYLFIFSLPKNSVKQKSVLVR